MGARTSNRNVVRIIQVEQANFSARCVDPYEFRDIVGAEDHIATDYEILRDPHTPVRVD